MKVAIYARVSKDVVKEHSPDGTVKRVVKQQNPEAQLYALRRYCVQKGWTVVAEFVDRETGANSDRVELSKMLEMAKVGAFHALLVWKLDRIFRSLRHITQLFHDLQQQHVKLLSATENTDVSTPTGRFYVNMLASVAELEREMISERTKMGLAFARSQGKKLGRPRKRDDLAIHRLRAKNYTFRQIREELGCSMGAVSRALK